MTIRFKLIAAALGLVVATGAVAEASANPVRTIAVTHGAKTVKVVAHPHHRLHFANRMVKHIRIAHRAPTLVKLVKVHAPKTFVKTVGVKTFKTTKIARINKAPLQRHAMFHRAGAKVTVVR